MTLQIRIAARANNLSRSIYASLPFEYRVARLLVQLKIATVSPASYGTLFYAEFIKAGVKEMPDIKGEPAEAWRPKLLKSDAYISQLGRLRYGGRFGEQMWALAKKLLGSYSSDENVEEVMQNVSLVLAGGSKQKIKGFTRSQAESFVKKNVTWRVGDIVRSEGPRTGPLLNQDLTDLTVDLADRREVTTLVHDIRQDVLQRALRKVDPQHPDWAWDWVKAQLQGDTNRDLAEKWGVANSTVTQWLDRSMPKIQKVFEAYRPTQSAI